MDDKILEDLKKEMEESIKEVEGNMAKQVENAMLYFKMIVKSQEEKIELKEKLFRLKRHMDKQNEKQT